MHHPLNNLINSYTEKKEYISEPNLRQLDSVLYKGRKITLILSSLLPLTSLIFIPISYVAMGILFGTGMISSAIFTFVDSYEKGKLSAIKQAHIEKTEIPIYPKNTKGLLAMNITNKVLAFCIPPASGFVMMFEMASLATFNICVLAGLISAIAIASLISYSATFERDYEKDLFCSWYDKRNKTEDAYTYKPEILTNSP